MFITYHQNIIEFQYLLQQYSFFFSIFFYNTRIFFCTSIVDNMLSPSSNDRWVIFHDSIHRHSFHIYICLLSTSIHKERSISVSRRLPQFTVEKKVFELNDLKFILYLKYDNFSTTWCMTRLPLLPIIYVRAHYIIQLEIHKNTKFFSGNTDAAVNRMEPSDWSIEISKNKLRMFGCIYNSNL